MSYWPRIKSATPIQHYEFGNHPAILLGDIEPADTLVRYHYLFIVFEEGGVEPRLIVASESNVLTDKPGSPGPRFLGVFDRHGRRNLGASDRWRDEAAFTARAVEIVEDELATRH